jgi:hypothetical protein
VPSFAVTGDENRSDGTTLVDIPSVTHPSSIRHPSVTGDENRSGETGGTTLVDNVASSDEPPNWFNEIHNAAPLQHDDADHFVQDDEINAIDNDVPTVIPSVTDPSVTDPSVTDPSVTDPSVTDSSVTDPSVTDPSVTDPSVTDPSVTDPSVTDPSVTDPSVTDSSVTDPSITDPSVTDPSVTDPSVTHSSVTVAEKLSGDKDFLSTEQQENMGQSTTNVLDAVDKEIFRVLEESDKPLKGQYIPPEFRNANPRINSDQLYQRLARLVDIGLVLELDNTYTLSKN